jgi:hypothetical protein
VLLGAAALPAQGSLASAEREAEPLPAAVRRTPEEPAGEPGSRAAALQERRRELGAGNQGAEPAAPRLGSLAVGSRAELGAGNLVQRDNRGAWVAWFTFLVRGASPLIKRWLITATKVKLCQRFKPTARGSGGSTEGSNTRVGSATNRTQH